MTTRRAPALLSVSALLAALALGAPATAARPAAEPPAVQQDHALGAVNIRLHNAEAQQVLNRALADDGYWADANQSTYSKQTYDEIRLKKNDNGYVPMITGEGDQDYDPEVVADIVFRRNVDLPRFMSGADAVVRLGSGYDAKVGAEYADSFYLLDFTLFYGHFTQRMYKKYDESTKQWIMWFEKLDESFVSGPKWMAYQAKVAKSLENHDRRWLFNGYQEVTDVYGMFVVHPGQERQTRVTFVSKLSFGEGSGFIAKAGSKMPSVIKAGLKAGFDGCVAIANDEKKRRLATTP